MNAGKVRGLNLHEVIRKSFLILIKSLYGSMLGKVLALVWWDHGPTQETICISIL